jgi:GNAT superfamily N-acetyltransferase
MRDATLADAPAVQEMLGRCFAPDPLVRWMFPVEEHRARAAEAWLGLSVGRYLRAGGRIRGGVRLVEQDGRPSGVAVWRWPEDRLDDGSAVPAPPLAGAATSPSAALLADLVGPEHAAVVTAGLAREVAWRPPGAHVCLHHLAVDPGRRRSGLGARLVTDGFERAAADGLPVFLETTTERNVAFYGRLGFTVHDSGSLGPGAPTIWVMRRPV